MRILIAVAALLATAGCGSKQKLPQLRKPSFVVFQLRSIGTPDDAYAPNTLTKATIVSKSCSESKDNRTIVLTDFDNLHIENLTAGSTDCRFLLSSFSMKGPIDELEFHPDVGGSAIELSTGNSATYIASNSSSVQVTVELGPTAPLGLKEHVSLSFLPLFSAKKLASQVTFEDFTGTGQTPQLLLTRVDWAGVLSNDGISGYNIEVTCNLRLEGTRCGATNLLDFRFRLLDTVPSPKERQNLVALAQDYQTQIIPIEGHIKGDRLIFAVTSLAQPGGKMAFIALAGDSVRLFEIPVSQQ